MEQYGLAKADIETFIKNEVVGSPIKLEHSGPSLGNIEDAWLVENDGIHIKGRLYSEAQCPGILPILKEMLAGNIRELSIKSHLTDPYTPHQQTFNLDASIVKEARFPGSQIISIEASSNTDQDDTNVHIRIEVRAVCPST
jgi:hypothetical protein